ncbi:YacL family protein [Shewanella insulae]|uniref:YacL family protein n=1 Tax=Shewanella insulae TaxID=2681496 RepID=UPI001EFDA32D|nr:YacL family protein [Shewanella insulae]MCG9713934.1 YacL family protein [Shewanella insulae]MCG9757342.1 YacL family protein [Shewanella insulae]
MEYEFRRNTLTGTLVAQFTMDHEIMGLWFVDELGEDKVLIEQIASTIAALQQGRLTEQRFVGKGISLELDEEQARVFANVLEMDEDTALDESMSLYDGESQAFCGLEDFETALKSWQAFIEESR